MTFANIMTDGKYGDGRSMGVFRDATFFDCGPSELPRVCNVPIISNGMMYANIIGQIGLSFDSYAATIKLYVTNLLENQNPLPVTQPEPPKETTPLEPGEVTPEETTQMEVDQQPSWELPEADKSTFDEANADGLANEDGDVTEDTRDKYRTKVVAYITHHSIKRVHPVDLTSVRDGSAPLAFARKCPL